jgi:hypothetical protein
MTDENTLREEINVFEKHKENWLRSNLGDFVVVFGANVVGFYSDYESAFKAGLGVAGLGNNFLVKQISVEDPVYILS